MVIELRRVLKQSAKVVTKVYSTSSNIQVSSGNSSPVSQDSSGQASAINTPTSSRKPLYFGGALFILIALAVVGYLLIFKEPVVKAPTFSFQSMKITRLTSSGKARTAAISPDGKYVVYSLDDAGKQSLWVRQVVTNSNVQIIPPDDVNYSGITLSCDGNYVYYVARMLTASVNALYQ